MPGLYCMTHRAHACNDQGSCLALPQGGGQALFVACRDISPGQLLTANYLGYGECAPFPHTHALPSSIIITIIIIIILLCSLVSATRWHMHMMTHHRQALLMAYACSHDLHTCLLQMGTT